ncbi:response regulator transcription factor [Paenibacillus guangzhouensis]|uniref:response regulator transcription factor n=1 Tax=Paenibacillus guangzhouensis TaxID=1473112 RepID=UPI0012669150|nr:response regulator transcription factor [Paenibacillus guangzhouensis]
MYSILIVEDDHSLAEILSDYMAKYGFTTKVVDDFSDVIGEYQAFAPHLVLLDVNLPKFDGFYWCRKLREMTTCPIIFISARNTDIDMIRAMDHGADDYVTKPFSADLIVSKINAQLRRVYGEYAQLAVSRRVRIGTLTYDYENLTLENNGKQVELSKKEAALAALLMENGNKVLRREKLLESLWDDESFVEENTLNVNVARLRKKLDEIDSNVEIETVRGIGYRMVEVHS